MSDEEAKLSRREFVKFSAMTSITAGGLYAITVKTDLLAQAPQNNPLEMNGMGDSTAYTYV